MYNSTTQSKIKRIQWALGLLCALIGAFLLWNGKHLGEYAASLGRTIGIIGVIAIGAAEAAMRRERK